MAESPQKKLNILLLCADAAKKTGTTKDHIGAFENMSRHRVLAVDSIIASRANLNLDLFDAIVFHYSIVISMSSYIPEEFAARLSRFSGAKMLFIQDEFRWVEQTMNAIEFLKISTVFTVVNDAAVRPIYRNPYFDNVRFEKTLTGFVPEHLLNVTVPRYEDRTTDVVYRARKLPAWCGSFAQQKWKISEQFERDAENHGLAVDMATSEDSRIYGDAWTDFISNSKATLGTESGASFVDFSGEIIPAVNQYEADNPKATFEQVRDLFLEGRDGNITINVISPRVFEAAALRTLMIMYPGEYSGVVTPGRHYVELKRDHSNMEEVVSILRDPQQAQKIIDCAYEEVAKSEQWSFSGFIRNFDSVVSEIFEALPGNRNPGLDASNPSANFRDAKAEIEKTVLAVQAEKARIEQQVRRKIRRQKLHAKIRQIMIGVYRAIDPYLPRMVSKPILNFGQRIVRELRSIKRRKKPG